MDLNYVNTFSQRLNVHLRPTVFVFSVLYFLLAAVRFIGSPVEGDEFIFISDLQFVRQHGFWAASAHPVSLPYMLFVYPLSCVLSPIVALRVLSICVIAFLLYYVLKIRKLNTDVIIYFLFYFGTANFFFKGLNDVVFIAGMVVFFIETMLYLDDKKNCNLEFGLLGLAIAFFTRGIVLLYSVPILIGCYLIFRSGWRPNLKKFIPVFLFTALLLTLNIPGIQQNEKLSYENKVPRSVKNANWIQLQYLAQLQVNQGAIPNYSYPTWAEVDEYLEVNGQESLPSTTLGSLAMDPELTIIEFFKDLADSIVFSTRLIGFMLFFCFFYFFRGYILRNESWDQLFIPGSLILILGIVSFLIISFIEPRWYASILLPATVFFAEQAPKEKYSHSLLTANFSVLCLLMLYGMFEWTIQ